MQRQSLKRGLNKDWSQEMQRQSLKRGLNKDWSQEMQRQSLKRSLNKDCEVAARLFLVENGSVLNLAVVWKNTSRLLSLSTAAFTCNCTKHMLTSTPDNQLLTQYACHQDTAGILQNTLIITNLAR